MGYSIDEAAARVATGARDTSRTPAQFGAWLDRIRAEMNRAQIKAVNQ